MESDTKVYDTESLLTAMRIIQACGPDASMAQTYSSVKARTLRAIGDTQNAELWDGVACALEALLRGVRESDSLLFWQPSELQ
jgi:hypothetical protein